jgi:hypothetical protein
MYRDRDTDKQEQGHIGTGTHRDRDTDGQGQEHKGTQTYMDMYRDMDIDNFNRQLIKKLEC